MQAFVITLEGNEYSEACTARCVASASSFGQDVSCFPAVNAHNARRVMADFGLRWTWANGNTAPRTCPQTDLRQHPYGDLESCMGCAMSHYLLWQTCVALHEPILILEHDAIFINALPEVKFIGICQINDPMGATPRGDYWSQHMADRGKGVWHKTRIFAGARPDGLAGNSAYMIKPWAAKELIDAYKRYGVWPNDAMMCIQLFPYLQELYPFVTRVQQTQSTTV